MGRPKPPRRISPAKSSRGRFHRNRPDFRQQFLKAASGAARAWVVAPELFDEFLVAVNDAVAALHMRL
jgi:hypothetical protein